MMQSRIDVVNLVKLCIYDVQFIKMYSYIVFLRTSVFIKEIYAICLLLNKRSLSQILLSFGHITMKIIFLYT